MSAAPATQEQVTLQTVSKFAEGMAHAGGDPSQATESVAPGLRYRILKQHARGGLGTVFLAHDEELHREVALKEIHLHHAHHTDSRVRFLLEAEVTGRLEHPSIVPVYGMGVYPDGRPFYAMRFIQGESLKDAIERFHASRKQSSDPGKVALELRQLLRRFLDICNAISYAHSRGVLHRDLKPANVMLGQFGETLVVDWGLAKAAVACDESGQSRGPLVVVPDGTETLMGSVMGTPAYMSPEQATGALDRLTAASDVFSLGAILTTVLCGQAPYRGENTLEKARRGDWLSPRQIDPETPAALDAICRKAMAFEPSERYASARALADDVEHWLADEPVSAYREPWYRQTWRWAKRHRTLVTGLAAAALVGIVSFVVIANVRAAAERRELAARQRERDANLAEIDGYERLGLIEHERGKKEVALNWFQQAFDKTIAIDNGERILRERRGRLGNHLARALWDIGREPQARQQYADALAVAQSLIAEDPDDAEARDELARSFSNLGTLERETGHPTEALKRFAQAIESERAAIERAPDDVRYPLALAAHFNDRSLVHEAQTALDAMRDDLLAALQVIEAAQSRQQESQAVTIQRQLALAHSNLGNCYTRQRDYDRAIQEFHIAADLGARLRKENPGTFEFDLLTAKAAMHEGLVHLRKLDPTHAVERLVPAREILLTLRERLPSDSEVQLAFATCQINVGQFVVQQIQAPDVPEVVRTRYRQQLTEQLQDADSILRNHVRDTKNVSQIALMRATVQIGFANLARGQKQWAETIVNCDKALALLKPLFQPGPEDAELALKVYLAELLRAEAQFRLGQHSDAIAAMDRLKVPEDQRLGISIMRAAMVARSGNYADGVAAAEKALTSAEGKAGASDFFDGAIAYSFALEALQGDTATAMAVREELAHNYAVRAIQLLREAVRLGPGKVEKIRSSGPAGDEDLAPLRKRAEFLPFLEELAKIKPR